MGGADTSPIFVGGCGRSGTTLLGSILGAHSECVCVPESPFKTDVLRFLDPATADTRRMLTSIMNTRRFQLWGLDLASLSESLAQFDGAYAQGLSWLVARYAECVGKPTSSRWV